jgi:hypothetical protein
MNPESELDQIRRGFLVGPGSFETDIWTRNAKVAEKMRDPESPDAARGTLRQPS